VTYFRTPMCGFGSAVASAFLLAGCALIPNAGPNKPQIIAGSVERGGDAFVVYVDDTVTQATQLTPSLGFPPAFLSAGQLTADIIRPGDALGLTIWENVDDGLLTNSGLGSTVLEEIQVDGGGFIFVPYAGRIQAAGNTPEELRNLITSRLEGQTPDPQVEVRRLAGDGASVTIAGATGQGVYAIERPTRRLSAMLASAGGVTGEPEITLVTVARGNQSGTVWYADLVKRPEFDIALRNGDRIFVEEDTRSFSALGATRTQGRIPFLTQTLSALDAVAQVGGLNPRAADPTGVFVIREEDPVIANRVLAQTDLSGPQRLIYVLSLTEPNGLFRARDFSIRDGDTIYVTEAPLTQFDKIIASLTGSLLSLDGLASASSFQSIP